MHPILPRIVAALALAVSLAATADAQTGAAPPSEEVTRGEYLARVGDCVSCHSSPEGGQFGGGLRMNTSFGYLITPNITFDPSTGIGGWTRDDFWNALHNGQSKHGYYLLPVQPALDDARVERAVLYARQLCAGLAQERVVESRRLYCRRARPLRRLPRTAQRDGGRREERRAHRRTHR